MANAHIQSIMGLPVITGTNPARIFEFYEKLVTNIQTLESVGKEKEIRSYLRLTLNETSEASNLVPRVLSLPRESTLVTAGHLSARF